MRVCVCVCISLKLVRRKKKLFFFFFYLVLSQSLILLITVLFVLFCTFFFLNVKQTFTISSNVIEWLMLATFFFFYPFSLLYSPISFLVLNQLLVETHFLCWTSPLFVLTNICFFGIYVDCFSVLARSKWLNEPGEKTQYSLRIKKHKCRVFFLWRGGFFFFLGLFCFLSLLPPSIVI